MSTKLWHNEFIDDWMCAFPLGNGRVGAMQYGNPHREQIEINEETLWSGRQIEERYHASPEALKEIRRLIFEERLDEAADLARATFLSNPPVVRSYESFGEIFIDFLDKSPYTNYAKELELSEAINTIRWTKSGADFKSECFISEEYDILVYKLTNGGHPFSCKVTMKRKQDAYSACIKDDTLIMNGRVTYAESHNYGEGGEGMSFGAELKVETDGILCAEHDSITVTNGTYLIIYGAFATNYDYEKFDIDESVDYRDKLKKNLERIKNTSYEDIKSKHISDHKKWFERVRFELDAPDFAEISADERLDDFRDGKEDNDLITLYYNFGRYLLIESSGKNAKLPANLQGIWCHDFNPPWGSDFHTNINLQMNYWPAGCTNLTDAEKPFIHFMKKVSKFGEKTAKELFEAKGWVINHTSDAFGRTGVHDSVDCGFFPMAGPWLCLNLWEHYEYTNDLSYLEEIYPILKGSCEFVKDYLIEDENGNLVTSPSNSPENEFYYTKPDGEKAESMLTHGATIDFQIIYALFKRTAHACTALGVDKEFAESLEATLKRLPPMCISERYGTIQEWIKDYEETEPGHRHISQLFGLYPSDQINESNPEIYEAAKKTIARRIENGGGSTGWSRAWTICFYARLKDGFNAEKHLGYLLKNCTAYNLFDIHPPFQIDGNFGGVAGITEMLIQSHLGSADNRIVELLPALPDNWKNGRICGVKARGNLTFDIEWAQGKVKEVVVSADENSILMLKLNDRTGTPDDVHCEIEDSVLKAAITAGEPLHISFN
ncbi:MAG: glycoside hydrolase N-terminal domain-containing protein [Clostridia bacterium]|nr:glycoside hydrolase N-terminal domain-containing protein [Clostridia bacterium]